MVCLRRFCMRSGYLYCIRVLIHCFRRLYCIRVLTSGVFKQVFYEEQYLYCIRVLTHCVFKQDFYEERVFILYWGTHTWCV